MAIKNIMHLNRADLKLAAYKFKHLTLQTMLLALCSASSVYWLIFKTPIKWLRVTT